MSLDERRALRSGVPAPPSSPRLAVVHWGYPDGSSVAGCPLEYERATALAEAYEQWYPDRRAWVVIAPAQRA
ncbi:MAG TPA: hypothetical protein VII13_15985 [Vicinamibacteria bacterium]|jgi:hypothetical protein